MRPPRKPTQESAKSVRPSWISEHIPPEIISSNIFKFAIKLFDAENVINVDVSTCVGIDYDNLEQEMAECPAQYVWWATVYSELKTTITILERRIKIRRGVLVDEAVRIAAEDRLRLTDKQVERIIEADDKLNKWEVHLATVQAQAGKLYHMVQAIQMKSEMLRSLAGFKRQEKEQQQRS